MISSQGSPDIISSRADFLAGQYFDIRLEVHSPVNGSEARTGEPDPDFKFTITKKDKKAVSAAKYFEIEEPELERWDFSWYEGKFLCNQIWIRKQINKDRSVRAGRREAFCCKRHFQDL